MGRKTPYLTKHKAVKNRGNKRTSGVTDNTSQDILYTTESNEPRYRYDYTNKYKNYKDYFTSDIYDSRLFDTYSPKRKGSGESYTFDDYTTSGISYNERKKRPKDLIYSVSTSEYTSQPPEKYNNASSFRVNDHSYTTGLRTREKKRMKLAKDLEKPNYHVTDILDGSEQYLDRSRKYRSPRSRYYQDLIHEEPEKEFDYETYFEKASPKAGSSPKQRRPDKYGDERYEKQNKLLSRASNERKNYQVYAYQDPKHHEEVFKGQNHPGDLSFSSEVEIKTHEYPVLAFRDPKSGNKESDMVYLPIIVLDKKMGKSRSEKRNEEPIYQPNKDNFQVYAANLQEQHNIFQNFGDLPNIMSSKDPTSKDRDVSPKQEIGMEATSGMRYAGSLLGTVIDEAVDTDFGNEDLSNETKTGQRIPFTTGKSPFTYQVDVDISPNETKGSLKDKDRKSSHHKNSSFNDPLHDGYPVTKDYIKVSASEQKKKSTLSSLTSKEKNKQSSVMGQKVSGEKNSSTIKEEAQTPSSIKLIDDQSISKSIAQSKTISPIRSIMRNPSQEQLLDKKFSPTRESVSIVSKHNSRAIHTGMADKENTKSKQTASKLSVLKEETSQDVTRKSVRTETPQQQSVIRSSRVASSGLAESTAGAETRHQSRGSARKSMKPEMQSAQTAGRRSEVHTHPSPVFDHQKSVLHSPVGQDRKSTVAHVMSNTQAPSSHNMSASHAQSRRSTVEDRKSQVKTPLSSPASDHRKSVSPSSENIRASHAQSRKSAVENRKSNKVQTPPLTQPFSVPDHRKSVSSSSENIRASHAQSRKSAVENRKSKVQTPPPPSTQPFSVSDHRKSVSPASQNMRASLAQSRKNAVAPRTSSSNLFRNDGRKSMKPLTPEQLQKAVPESGKKSLAQRVSHHNNHTVAVNSKKLSHKVEKEDDSEEALRKFTKDVFAVDLGSQGKTPPHISDQKKPSTLKDKFISDVSPNHEVESKRQSRKSADGQQPLNTFKQSQNGLGNVEPLHELIGDNSVAMGTAPTLQEEKIRRGSAFRTTSKIFTTLSKIGKKKSTEQVKPATVTQDNKDSHFVRSIEPTVTQYKKDQNKTHTLTKSKSKPDNKAPKEKKSLTRLFSRSKSKQSNESGEETKKKKKKKSRSLLGILKRSKSSEMMAAPPAEGEESAGDSTPSGCECLAQYVQTTRVCAYFFLGTTLHEQIMNIIKIFLSGN